MERNKGRVYSHYSRKAAALLGDMIQLHRKQRRISLRDLADRAGISRTTLQKIESGNLRCEIGIVFEVAALVGIKLFDADSPALESLQERTKDKIMLLPKSIRPTNDKVEDDF